MYSTMNFNRTIFSHVLNRPSTLCSDTEVAGEGSKKAIHLTSRGVKEGDGATTNEKLILLPKTKDIDNGLCCSSIAFRVSINPQIKAEKKGGAKHHLPPTDVAVYVCVSSSGKVKHRFTHPVKMWPRSLPPMPVRLSVAPRLRQTAVGIGVERKQELFWKTQWFLFSVCVFVCFCVFRKGLMGQDNWWFGTTPCQVFRHLAENSGDRKIVFSFNFFFFLSGSVADPFIRGAFSGAARKIFFPFFLSQKGEVSKVFSGSTTEG